MEALFVFLIAAAVGGMFARSFTWRTYGLVAVAASVLTIGYYYGESLW